MQLCYLSIPIIHLERNKYFPTSRLSDRKILGSNSTRYHKKFPYQLYMHLTYHLAQSICTNRERTISSDLGTTLIRLCRMTSIASRSGSAQRLDANRELTYGPPVLMLLSGILLDPVHQVTERRAQLALSTRQAPGDEVLQNVHEKQ